MKAFFSWLARLFTPTPAIAADDSQYLSYAPWVAEAMKMLGWDENTHDKELTKLCWPHTKDCKYLSSVRGSSNAWCSGFWVGIMAKLSLPHTASGAAASWRNYGDKCGYIFGAFIPMQHKSGGNHITVFLWWIDEKKKIAACLGGNQSNKVSIAAYNLSGKKAGHDEVMGGPRWPGGRAQTKGPYQPKGWKVGTSLGSSTR